MEKNKLSDFIEKYGDGIHGTPNYSKSGDYYFVNGNNLIDGEITINKDTQKIDCSEYERIKRPLTDKTILLSINGTLGRIAEYSNEKIALGKSVCYINAKTTENKYFIKTILSTKEFQKYIQTVAHGSTIKNLAPSQVNDYEFSYTIGQTSPEFYAETGVDFTLPFEKLSLNFQALQRIGKELDYEVYGDSLYFGNQFTFSLPVTVYETMDYTKLYLIPYADFTINYDYNGISQSNYNLSSPVVKTGVQFKANDINWLGNFREGWYADVSAYYGYNFQQQTSVPGASFNMQAFKAFNRFALAGRLYGFIQSEKSPYYKVGEYLRGIRDETRFAPGTGYDEEIALNVESVILLNIDFPVKLFTWDWTKFTDSHFWSNLNFDVQLSPFIDMALTSNPASGRNFHPADGYYSAGFEVLVYPEKWKGIVVRGSLGFDLGDLFLSKTNFYESSWRRDVSAYEIYIGIGLHY